MGLWTKPRASTSSALALVLAIGVGTPGVARGEDDLDEALGGGEQVVDGAVLKGLALADTEDSVTLEIESTERPNCGDFTIADPPTLVVSCVGMTIGDNEPVLSVENGVIEVIHLSESSDIDGTNTEVRLLLTALFEYDRNVNGNLLTLTLYRKPQEAAAPEVADSGGEGADAEEAVSDYDAIAAAMGAAEEGTSTGPGVNLRLESTRTGELSSVAGDHNYAGSGTQIRGVDFQNQLHDGISRLVITGNDGIDYVTSYPSSRRMIISLRNAVLGTGLERKIDTSQFASAVDGVSAFRSRKVKGEVKVVVDLREEVAPTISEQGGVLVIDFPIPPAIAGAAYVQDAVVESYDEPAEDDDALADDQRIESAIGREKLIGPGGEAIDPAKAATRRVKSVFGGHGVFLGEVDPAHQWRGFPINLNLVNASIHNVFRLIAAVSKLNIVTSDQVEGLVTVQLHEVPWDQALAAVLQAKGLGAVQYGSIIRVAPIEVIRREREDAAAAMQAEVDSLPLRVLTLPLNYASANDVMQQLENMLSGRGSVTFDERTNSLIVRDIDRQLSQIRQLVRTLDTRTPQVHIEARIVEANSFFSRSLGIQWGGNLNFSPSTGAPTGLFFPNSVGVSGGQTASTVSGGSTSIGGRPANFTTSPNYVVDLPASATGGSLGLSLGSITNLVNLDARLTAGENIGNGKVISAPSITTVTNQAATIRDGARIPYETASLRGTNVQFVEAVLLLQVTPQITADGTIFLDIALTKNRPEFGATVRGLPTIQIKEANTTVMVHDGDTTVIGGVYSYEESVSKTFLPGLGRIPVLGWLFKTTTRRTDRRELLVFITPTIVRQAR